MDERTADLNVKSVKAHFIYSALLKNIDFDKWDNVNSFETELPPSRVGLIPYVSIKPSHIPLFYCKEIQGIHKDSFFIYHHHNLDSKLLEITNESSDNSCNIEIEISSLVGVKYSGASYATVTITNKCNSVNNDRILSLSDIYKIVNLVPRTRISSNSRSVVDRTSLLKFKRKTKPLYSFIQEIFSIELEKLCKVDESYSKTGFSAPFPKLNENDHDPQIPFIVLNLQIPLNEHTIFLRALDPDTNDRLSKEEKAKYLRTLIGLAFPVLHEQFIDYIRPDQFHIIAGGLNGFGKLVNLTISGLIVLVSQRVALIISPDYTFLDDNLKKQIKYTDSVTNSLLNSFEILSSQRFSLLNLHFQLEKIMLHFTKLQADNRDSGLQSNVTTNSTPKEPMYNGLLKEIDYIEKTASSLIDDPLKYIRDSYLPTNIALDYAEKIFRIEELERSLIEKTELTRRVVNIEKYSLNNNQI